MLLVQGKTRAGKKLPRSRLTCGVAWEAAIPMDGGRTGQ